MKTFSTVYINLGETAEIFMYAWKLTALENNGDPMKYIAQLPVSPGIISLVQISVSECLGAEYAKAS